MIQAYFWVERHEDRKIIKLIKGLVNRFKKGTRSSHPVHQATIITRENHCISRNNIHRNALKVLYRLHSAGYQALLVGGCVRDLLLGHRPKDFDVATNAHPEEIRKLFKNCRLIGKRFRLAHIVFGHDIIEVATFRTHHENAEHEQHAKTHHGMIVRDNVYGKIEDDVMRRDFTINGLYYNIADFSVIDFISGMRDIQTRTLHIIGEPEARYNEDPVRLLRAIRFMGKLSLLISPETEAPIQRLSSLLQKVSPARLYLEVSKLFHDGAMLPTFRLLKQYHLFAELFPATDKFLADRTSRDFIELALKNTDQRVKEEKSISPAFLFTVFAWPSTLHYLNSLKEHKLPAYVAHEKAVHLACRDLIERLAIPKNLSAIVREISVLQFRFTQRFGTRPYRLLGHPRYRAAYDLLVLRAEVDHSLRELSDWWTKFMEASETERDLILKQMDKNTGGVRRKTRRPPRAKKKITPPAEST